VTDVRTDDSEKRTASIIRATRIGELGTFAPITVNICPSSLILFTLMMETIRSSESSVLTGLNMFPVSYEIGFYIPEDGISS
jgi:hypothetical protein